MASSMCTQFMQNIIGTTVTSQTNHMYGLSSHYYCSVCGEGVCGVKGKYGILGVKGMYVGEEREGEEGSVQQCSNMEHHCITFMKQIYYLCENDEFGCEHNTSTKSDSMILYEMMQYFGQDTDFRTFSDLSDIIERYKTCRPSISWSKSIADEPTADEPTHDWDDWRLEDQDQEWDDDWRQNYPRDIDMGNDLRAGNWDDWIEDHQEDLDWVEGGIEEDEHNPYDDNDTMLPTYIDSFDQDDDSSCVSDITHVQDFSETCAKVYDELCEHTCTLDTRKAISWVAFDEFYNTDRYNSRQQLEESQLNAGYTW